MSTNHMPKVLNTITNAWHSNRPLLLALNTGYQYFFIQLSRENQLVIQELGSNKYSSCFNKEIRANLIDFIQQTVHTALNFR
jgi:hypothetical protein